MRPPPKASLGSGQPSVWTIVPSARLVSQISLTPSAKISAENPEIFALGVKEIWETKRALGTIVHTLGWPLPSDAFGGGLMYPLAPNLVAAGLVVGPGYRDT